jgi:hypothetical protein
LGGILEKLPGESDCALLRVLSSSRKLSRLEVSAKSKRFGLGQNFASPKQAVEEFFKK